MNDKLENDFIPADSWIPVFLEMLKEGKQIKISPHGFSMYPYLVSDRDEVILEAPKREYRRGDIALYRRDTGLYVLHRVHHVSKNHKEYYMLGDSQKNIEGPLRKEQLLAIAVTIIRNHKEISVDSFWYKVSYHLWFTVRIFRVRLIKVWRKIRRIFGKKDTYTMPW